MKLKLQIILGATACSMLALSALARDSFAKGGAQDICSTGEASAPGTSRAANRGSMPNNMPTHPVEEAYAGNLS